MYCMQCGSQMPDHSSFCPFCGAPSPYAAAKKAKETGAGPEVKDDSPRIRTKSAADAGSPAEKPAAEASPVIPDKDNSGPEMHRRPEGYSRPVSRPDLKNYTDTVMLPKAEENLTVEIPAADVSIPSAEKSAAGVNIPSAEKPAAGVNVPSAEKPAAGVNVPSAEKPAAGVNIPSAEKPAAGAKIPSAEKPAAGVNVPSAEKPAAGVNIPSAEKPADRGNRPAAADHAVTEKHSDTESIPAHKRVQGSLNQSPEYLQKLAEANARKEAESAAKISGDKNAEAGPVISKVFDAGGAPADKVGMDATPTEMIDTGKADKGAAFAGAPGADTPDKGAAYAGAADGKKTGGKPSDPSPRKKEKSGGKKILIIGGVVLIAILAVVLVKVFEHNNKVKQYNEGVAQLESKNYEEALKTFTELGTYEDSEYMASYAQMEIDYLTLDDLVAAGDYSRVVEILDSRSEFYSDSDTGKEAAALADEYEAVSAAYSAMESGNYAQAEQKFDSLDTLKNDYARDKCLCSAYVAEDEQNWVNAIVNLYAIQDNDTAMDFLQNPEGDQETMLSEAYNSGGDLDPDKVDELLQTEDEELAALKTTAISGLRYNDAKELLDAGKYEDAMDAFEALGDFQDSAVLYEEAKAGYDACEATYAAGQEYYDNGEYYKARKEFLSISGYKDADDKAESCVQPLPENGSLKSGNGGIAFTIYAPDINESVFVKIYDSDGDAVGQVFLHPNSNSTVSMAAGTYTIKVAYGTEWYGEIDLFGDDGVYYQLLNGSSTEFGMENGYTYSLELLTSTDGNVGSQSLGGPESM